jgi:glycosyltransferase involved in cell wall biosynthesis
MDISVVAPVYNEESSLKELIAWVNKVMTENHLSWEIILIDDGSRDNSWQIIESLQKDNPEIKGIKFRRNYGKAAALHCGFDIVAGDVVVTIDSDLQDSPDEIPELYNMIKNDGYDLVSGWKKKRLDPLFTKN